MRPFKDEQDIEVLRQVAIAQEQEVKKLLTLLADKSALIEKLTGSHGDLQACLEVLHGAPEPNAKPDATPEKGKASAGDEASVRTKPAASGHGPKPQRNLERTTRRFDLDEPDKICPQCGGQLRPIKGVFESSEMIDHVALKYVIVDVQRQKSSCACGGCVETAPGPERAVVGGRYSLDFALHVATSKYLDHIPLKRLCKMMERAGLEVTATTLWDQLWAVTNLLRPAYDALHERLLAEPIVGLDQTGWPNLDSKSKKAWQMWGFTAEGMATYKICADKSADTMKKLIGTEPRILICDMLSTHGKVARDVEGIVLAGCWAHAARRFKEAAEDHPQAKPICGKIAELFAIDAKATSLEHKAKLRDTESRQVVKDILQQMYQLAVPSTTSLGSAARYVLKYQRELSVFLDDARVCLDNNATERALRGPVVGRKNHYGSKSRAGTEAAAIFYSLFETAKLQGVNPEAYLREAAIAGRRGEVLLPGGLA